MTPHVVMYSKPGCHLCEETRSHLEQLRQEFDLRLEEIDISTDPALFKKYFDKIPVVWIDERIQLAAPIRPAELRAALKSLG